MAFIERNYKVTVNDIDKTGICTNKAILRFFETTACEHSDMAGYGISDICRTNLSWVLLQWKLNCLKRLSYGESVRVVTWARDTDAFTSYRDFKLFNGSGELCAIATSKWALVDVNKGLSRIGSIIEDNYNPEKDCVFNERTLAKISLPQEREWVFDYKVMAHDIDINQHMHNLNYLDLAVDGMPEGKDFAFTEILYKTQCKMGENLSVFRSVFENEVYVIINVGERLSAAIKFFN